MAKTPRPWTVLPHGPLEKVEPNLWLVDARLTAKTGGMNRRMAIARLADGRLVFHNGIPLRDAELAELTAWGRPAILIVPNGYHRLDVHAFKARFPGMKVLCPAAVHARVSQVVEVDGHYDAFPADPSVRMEPLDGTKNGEGVLVVRSGERATLVFADAVMNLAHLPGLDGLLFRLLGSTGGPRVTQIAKVAMVKDRRAVAAHLERLAAEPGLTRLSVSHGQDVTADAPGVLKGVAARLRG